MSSSSTFTVYVEDLRSFLASEKGQELLRQVGQLLKDVEQMSSFCRVRGRAFNGVRCGAGAVIAASSATLMGVGAIGVVGPAAAPIAACLASTAAGASASLGMGLAAQIITALTRLGLSQAEGKQVAERLEKLKSDLGDWDIYFQRALCVANEGCGSEVSQFANVDLLGAGIYLPAKAVAKVGLQTASASSVSVAATGMVYKFISTISGVGVIVGLTDTINGFRSAVQGSCSEADVLDRYADKICALLRVMLSHSVGTPAYDELQQKTPRMLHVWITRWRRPRPNYRPGDFAKRLVNGPPQQCDAYFQMVLGARRTCLFEQFSSYDGDVDLPWLVKMQPGVEQQDCVLHVLTRISAVDDICEISAFAQRSLVTQSTVGNPLMGSTHRIEFVSVAPDGTCSDYRHELGEEGMITFSCECK